MPIFAVALCADTPVELVELPGSESAAISSVSPPDPQNGCSLLATLRCQVISNTENIITLKRARAQSASRRHRPLRARSRARSLTCALARRPQESVSRLGVALRCREGFPGDSLLQPHSPPSSLTPQVI